MSGYLQALMVSPQTCAVIVENDRCSLMCAGWMCFMWIHLGNTPFAFASAEFLTDGDAPRALVTGYRSARTRSALQAVHLLISAPVVVSLGHLLHQVLSCLNNLRSTVLIKGTCLQFMIHDSVNEQQWIVHQPFWGLNLQPHQLLGLSQLLQ